MPNPLMRGTDNSRVVMVALNREVTGTVAYRSHNTDPVRRASGGNPDTVSKTSSPATAQGFRESGAPSTITPLTPHVMLAGCASTISPNCTDPACTRPYTVSVDPEPGTTSVTAIRKGSCGSGAPRTGIASNAATSVGDTPYTREEA